MSIWAAIIPAAAGLVGSAMSSRSASKAADQQEASAREGLAQQREMYDIGREDLAPYRDTGSAANARLSYMLGLEGGGNPAVAQAQDNYNAALQRYNSLAAVPAVPEGWRWDPSPGGYRRLDDEGNTEWMDPQLAEMYRAGGVGGGSVSTAGVDAARSALTAAQAQPWTAGGSTGEGYGSLMERFPEMTPFTGQNIYDDPGYQFRLEEGRKGIENSAAARGMQLSGPNQKDLNRYSQNYASNEYNNARNRWIGDYTDARNRFIGNQDQTVNYLTAPTNRGLNAASQGATAAAGFGNAQSNTLQSIGNAQSAGTVASGNAWQSGINNAYNAYQDSQQTQRLNAILRDNDYGGYGYNGGAYSTMRYAPKSY